MTVSLHTFFRLAMAAAALALGSQAHAASVTVDAGAACTAFSWNQSTSTLTCQVTTDCVITGATSAAPGSNVVLTASCPTSTSITWSGGSCAGQTGATCTANESSTGNVTYTADGNNSAPDTHNVNWTTTTVAPSGCSLSASPGSGPSGTNVTLTANCTTGTNPIAIAWGGASGTSGCPTTLNVGSAVNCAVNSVTSNSTWTASFSNAAGQATSPSNPRSASFTVQSGGGAFAGCPGGTVTIDGQWGNMTIDTAAYGEFGANQVSVRLVPPTGFTGTTIRTSSWSEFGSAPVIRHAVFSKNPCDFTTANAVKNSQGIAFIALDVIAFGFKYRAGSPSTTSAGLTAGTSYYINIRNYYSGGALSCTGTSDCRMRGGIPP